MEHYDPEERRRQYNEELRVRAKRLRDRGFCPSDPNYWNRKYTEDTEAMEWYQSYDELEPILSEHVKPGQKVLIVGCGNSELGERLYKKGVIDITNIDFSEVVIDAKIREQEEKAEKNDPTDPVQDGMRWISMDVRDMDKEECPDHTFNAVIDKACLDSNLSGPGSARNVDHMLSEVSRVLVPLGKFISVSFAKPEMRLPFLEKDAYKWKVTDQSALPKPTIDDIPDTRNSHFVYVMERGP